MTKSRTKGQNFLQNKGVFVRDCKGKHVNGGKSSLDRQPCYLRPKLVGNPHVFRVGNQLECLGRCMSLIRCHFRRCVCLGQLFGISRANRGLRARLWFFGWPHRTARLAQKDYNRCMMRINLSCNTSSLGHWQGSNVGLSHIVNHHTACIENMLAALQMKQASRPTMWTRLRPLNCDSAT